MIKSGSASVSIEAYAILWGVSVADSGQRRRSGISLSRSGRVALCSPGEIPGGLWFIISE